MQASILAEIGACPVVFRKYLCFGELVMTSSVIPHAIPLADSLQFSDFWEVHCVKMLVTYYIIPGINGTEID